MERTVILVTVKSGIVWDIQSNNAEALIIVHDKDAGEKGYNEGSRIKPRRELKKILKTLTKGCQ